jgi:Lantibiotic biosynthesis dehydratase C-term
MPVELPTVVPPLPTGEASPGELRVDLRDRRWVSLHAHTYGDLDTLILKTGPLLKELRTAGRPAYFTRHWACGPHLRLHTELLGQEMTLPEPWASLTWSRLNDALTLSGPELWAPFDWARAARVYPRLVADEQYVGQVWPPLPHGHLHLLPRQRTLGVLGGPAAGNLIDEANLAMDDTVLETLSQVKCGVPLLTLCFDLMVAVADRTAPDTALDNGFLSYRSHAEIFLIGAPVQVRQSFNGAYERQRETLRRRIDAVLNGSAAQDGLIRSWRRTLGVVHAAAWTALESGHIDLSWEAQDFSLERPEMGPALARSQQSEFHRTELANFENLRRRSRDVSFNAYRLLLNALYLQLNRLGLTPLQRALLCHLVSHAVEERYSVRAVDLSARYAYLEHASA